MKWEYSICSQVGNIVDGVNQAGKPSAELDQAQLGLALANLGERGWEVACTLNGWLILKRPMVAGDVDQSRPGYQGVLDPEQREKVLWVWKHQQPAMTFENGHPVPTFTDCSHLFDAVVLEEHEAAVKIVSTMGSEHGGAMPGQAFWAKRRDLRFIARGEAVPELDGDPENDALRKMIDG